MSNKSVFFVFLMFFALDAWAQQFFPPSPGGSGHDNPIPSWQGNWSATFDLNGANSAFAEASGDIWETFAESESTSDSRLEGNITMDPNCTECGNTRMTGNWNSRYTGSAGARAFSSGEGGTGFSSTITSTNTAGTFQFSFQTNED